MKIIKYTFPAFLVLLFCLVPSHKTLATTYGSGNYGACTYGVCSYITITTSANLNVNVTPNSGGACSINNDSVTVLTDDTSGYTVSINSTGSSSSLTNGTSNITAVSGNFSSPSSLNVNQWGYRVDSQGGFGSGPTSVLNNANYPLSAIFAAVPSSSSTPSTAFTSSSAADPAVTTSVWYGVCADTTLTSGNYSGSVLYTAISN